MRLYITTKMRVKKEVRCFDLRCCSGRSALHLHSLQRCMAFALAMVAVFLLRLLVCDDVVDGVSGALDLVGVGVGDLDAKLVLERHHHLDGVKAVET